MWGYRDSRVDSCGKSGITRFEALSSKHFEGPKSLRGDVFITSNECVKGESGAFEAGVKVCPNANDAIGQAFLLEMGNADSSLGGPKGIPSEAELADAFDLFDKAGRGTVATKEMVIVSTNLIASSSIQLTIPPNPTPPSS
jgi:hypothetical protein